MNEIPGLPPPDGEWKIREAAQELRMEQARLLAEENEPKIYRRLPLRRRPLLGQEKPGACDSLAPYLFPQVQEALSRGSYPVIHGFRQP